MSALLGHGGTERGRASATPMPLPPPSSTQSVEADTGEILLLPAALWASIDAALEALAGQPEADQDTARTAFAGAFAQALHRNGLLLVEQADPRSTQTVSVATYSLALQGKHTAEAKLHAAQMLVRGWPSPDPLTARTLRQEFGDALLALTGRAPPERRHRIGPALQRLRALDAILQGSPSEGWDLARAEPLSPELLAVVEGEATP